MNSIPSIDVYELLQGMKRKKLEFDKESLRLQTMSECLKYEIDNIELEFELYLKQFNKKAP